MEKEQAKDSELECTNGHQHVGQSLGVEFSLFEKRTTSNEKYVMISIIEDLEVCAEKDRWVVAICHPKVWVELRVVGKFVVEMMEMSVFRPYLK